MQRLEFDFSWEVAEGIKGAELASTWASLRIRVNDSVLTRVVDHGDNRVRECIHVPLYPLAEWLATNWWFLLHESDGRAGLADRSFLERHAIGPAREGYRFPNVYMVPFDTGIRVTWKHEKLQWTGLEFLEREGCEWIDREKVLESCTGFVDAVVARLAACDIRETLLQEEWQAIQCVDQDERRFCETSAALGLDPYSLDEVVQARVIGLEDTLSGAVLEEALPVLRAERLETELVAIARVFRVGRSSGIPLQRFTSVRNKVVQSVESQPYDRPWTTGYSLARSVRKQLDLDDSPLATWRTLSQALEEPRIKDGRLPRSKAFNRATLLDGGCDFQPRWTSSFCFPLCRK